MTSMLLAGAGYLQAFFCGGGEGGNVKINPVVVDRLDSTIVALT